MTHPQVLDAQGAELRIGSEVKRLLPNGSAGGVPGVVTLVGHQVDVTWVARDGAIGGSTFAAPRISWLSRTRRCPDLTLATEKENQCPFRPTEEEMI